MPLITLTSSSPDNESADKMAPMEIVAVGHIINETIEFPGQETRAVLGSPPAYSMACAASLGAHAGILTRIGDDYPDELLEPLRACGVDLTGVIRAGQVSTNNKLVYAEDGTKTIHYLTRAPLIEPSDLPPAYENAKLIYICPMDWDTTPESVERLAKSATTSACDLGGFGGAHSPAGEVAQMVRDPDAVERVVASMDIVKASDEDCRRLTGDRDLDLRRFAEQWLAWGAQIAVITLGAAGSLVLTPNETHEIPALQGDPIDPTGGGDSYMGGFLVGYLRAGGDPYRAGLYGTATALCVIEGTGGVHRDRMPTANDVETRLQAAGKA